MGQVKSVVLLFLREEGNVLSLDGVFHPTTRNEAILTNANEKIVPI
jgi:hypothetical protein